MNSAIPAAILALSLVGEADTRPSVARLDWLVGHWCSDSGIEELWLTSPGDLMLGVNRTVVGGRTRAFEFLRIAADGNGVRYLAQPGGREATAFRLTDTGERWARFDNPAHDFPQRIEYRRDGERLVAEISGPGEGGRVKSIPFEFEPCRG